MILTTSELIATLQQEVRILYLKACGREELSTMNLWAGADMPAKA